MAPDTDEKGHGNQHHFPEQEKEEEVQREKNADDANFQHQQHNKKFFYAMVDAGPRGQHGNGRQEGGENHQEHAETVNAKVIVDGWGTDPRVEFRERISRGAHRNLREQQHGENKLDHGDEHRETTDPDMIVGAQQ